MVLPWYAVGQQAFSQAMQRTGNAVVAQTEAQTALAGIQDPFAMEPCAMAVFMYLSREVEYRDAVIEQLNERLVGLGAKPLDVEHPYPPTSPVPDEEVEKAGETLPEDAEDGDPTDDEKKWDAIADESRAAADDYPDE